MPLNVFCLSYFWHHVQITPWYTAVSSIGTFIRLTHQRQPDHRTPEYDARTEYDPGMTPVYTQCMYSEYDTRMTPTTPRWHQRHPPSDTSVGRSVRRLHCKSPTTKPTSEMQAYQTTRIRIRELSRAHLQTVLLKRKQRMRKCKKILRQCSKENRVKHFTKEEESGAMVDR